MNWGEKMQINRLFEIVYLLLNKKRVTANELAEHFEVSKRTILIEKFTNEELFEKKNFDWTGTSTLGAYCVSATSSHYDWAMKKIKAHIKAYRKDWADK